MTPLANPGPPWRFKLLFYWPVVAGVMTTDPGAERASTTTSAKGKD
jgi:hypothetical protein